MGKSEGQPESSRLKTNYLEEENLNVFKRNKYSELVRKHHFQIHILHIRIASSIVYEIKCTFVP